MFLDQEICNYIFGVLLLTITITVRKFNAFDVIVAQHLRILCSSLSKHQNMFQNFTGLVHQPVPLKFNLQFIYARIFLILCKYNDNIFEQNIKL